jgi:hypothetical protein
MYEMESIAISTKMILLVHLIQMDKITELIEGIQSLIYEGISNGKFHANKGIYYYDVTPTSAEVLKIVVGNSGCIVTAFPFGRVEVPIPL